MRVTIILAENQESGGVVFKKNCLEVCILNSFCMEKMVRSGEHQQRERKKRDMQVVVALTEGASWYGTSSSRRKITKHLFQ